MFRFREFRIDIFDDTFKGREFHHCVGDLATPERLKAFVQAGMGLAATCEAGRMDERDEEGGKRGGEGEREVGRWGDCGWRVKVEG
jgi:hypothetical protein